MQSSRGDYSITREEFMELKGFCLRYHQMKQAAADMITLRIATPTPEELNATSHGSGRVSDPVASQAARREKLLRNVDMIDMAARYAAADLAPYIIKAVTRKSGVRGVLAEVPCSQASFYRMRRQFFWILREMRSDI